VCAAVVPELASGLSGRRVRHRSRSRAGGAGVGVVEQERQALLSWQSGGGGVVGQALQVPPAEQSKRFAVAA
jgi:hypothetical protein